MILYKIINIDKNYRLYEYLDPQYNNITWSKEYFDLVQNANQLANQIYYEKYCNSLIFKEDLYGLDNKYFLNNFLLIQNILSLMFIFKIEHDTYYKDPKKEYCYYNKPLLSIGCNILMESCFIILLQQQINNETLLNQIKTLQQSYINKKQIVDQLDCIDKLKKLWQQEKTDMQNVQFGNLDISIQDMINVSLSYQYKIIMQSKNVYLHWKNKITMSYL